MAQRSRGKAIRLTRARVVEEAIRLADAGGFDSLSMRNLADELGTAPMSLYRHVGNKDELLDEMVDVVFGEMYVPVVGGAWKSELRKRGTSARAALNRHPWAIGLMESSKSPGPASAEHHNATMGCLREAGFPFKDAVHAYNLLDAYTYGFALQENTIPFDTPEESAEMAKVTVGERGDEFPYLAEVVVELGKSGYDYTEEFEFGLDVILDALERLKKRASGSERKTALTTSGG
ncbi:MAG TPA: TetR/AcrR family transcriptional regulator [Actinomycetota bacterium]|nr:TetR/AcrR family transcriptional regulator [Actinomycetota bacterium]